MKLIVTMAGRSQRFRNHGFTMPKWRIEINGMPMLYWSIAPFKDKVSEVFFVTLKSEDAHEQIRLVCEKAKLKRFKVIALDETPNGQAMSALKAIEIIEDDSPIMIWNVDTMLNTADLSFPTEGFWMTVSELTGDYWSFARIREQRVVEVAEKVRISKYASIGLYGFPSSTAFKQLLEPRCVSNETFLQDELYVAPLYNNVINCGSIVLPNYLPSELVIPLGTPEQLHQANKMGKVSLEPEVQALLSKIFIEH